MPAPLWLRQTRAAREVTAGTPVTPATRRLYLIDPQVADAATNIFHKFATATRDNVRAITTASKEPSATASLPAGSDELIEWALITHQGAVTPSTPAGGTLTRDWVFIPSTTSDSMTLEYDDAARAWQAAGVRGNGMTHTITVGGDSMVALDLFASDLNPAALTGGALTERVPVFSMGWETHVAIGAADTDPATLNNISGLVKSATVTTNNNLGRKYLANNTQTMSAVVPGEFDGSMDLLIEADNAQALTEYTAWRNGTKRVIRVTTGNNEQIEASPTNEVQTFTTTGTPTGGNIVYTFMGASTPAAGAGVPFNATAAQVQSFLEALPTIRPGNVVVTGGPLPTGVVVTFANQLAGLNVPAFTTTHSLTGGTTPASVVTQTTPGVGYKRLIYHDMAGAWETFSMNEEDAGTRMYRGVFRYVYSSVLAYGYRMTLRTGRATAF